MTEDDLPPRIKSKIYFGDYCWFWMAARQKNGYGNVRVALRYWRAHRLVYTLLVGPIPEGLELDHLCRVRRCVRPSHLEPVTSAENKRRGRNAEAQRARHAGQTHCTHGHAFTPRNTYVDPRGFRSCRACRRERRRASVPQ